jgi:hypothetical protein
MIILLAIASFANGGNFEDFNKDSRLADLSPAVRCFFDAAAQNGRQALKACFTDDVAVNITGMQFKSPDEVADFAESDIWGGKYKVEEVFRQDNSEIVHCLFWPKGWSAPEPAIEYEFRFRKGKIAAWLGKYR